MSGHKGQCGALSAQKQYIATTAAATTASAKQQAPQKTAAPQPQPSLKKSTEATNAAPSLFSPTQLSNLLSTRPQELGVGLVNRGNTCYINSVLQCFSHTAPLRAYLASSEHSRSCKVRTHGFCLLCALEEHTKQLFRVKNEFFPRDIFLNLQQIGDFRPFAQEDAHEFASSVMMGMQSSILQNYRAQHPNGPPNLGPGFEETSLVYQLFGGRSRSRVRCGACSAIVTNYEPFLDLNLELSAGASLEEALDSYTTIEHFDLSTGYKCGRCNKVVTAQKQLTVDRAPPILVVQLKRFDVMSGGGKINKTVTFREQLDIAKVMSEDKKEEGGVLYELYGTIVHYGRTMFSGHYVSFIKSNGLWHLFDDDQVVEVNNAIVLKQNAYMLFFQRVYTPEQMARQEQQLLQLPQQLSLPQESQQQQQQQQQSKSQRRRNNKKTNEANNAQQQQQTAAPAVATEAKAEPPPEWKLPKYRVFYTEEESGEESWIKDLLLVAEVPAEANDASRRWRLSVESSGRLTLHDDTAHYRLELQLPFEVDPKAARASFYQANATLVATMPLKRDDADADADATKPDHQATSAAADVEVALLPDRRFVLKEIGVDPEKELNVEPVATEEKEKEVETVAATTTKPADAAASTTSDDDKKVPTTAPALPFMDLGRLKQALADESNKEEASYAKLWDDIRAFYAAVKSGDAAGYLQLRSAIQRQEAQRSQQLAQDDEEQFMLKLKKTKRNDPCPCNSGRKFKQCHGMA